MFGQLVKQPTEQIAAPGKASNRAMPNSARFFQVTIKEQNAFPKSSAAASSRQHTDTRHSL